MMIEPITPQVDSTHLPAKDGVPAVRQELASLSAERVAVTGRDHFSQSLESAALVQKLKQRDQEVRNHEKAHIAAGGAHIQGGASFTYHKGPDGHHYAVGGEVNIDTATVPNDPLATMEKAQSIMRAAMAPSVPSAQDMSVAASAAQMIAEARIEQSRLQTEPQAPSSMLMSTEQRLSAYAQPANLTGEAVSLFV